jgi:hypothetical protein
MPYFTVYAVTVTAYHEKGNKLFNTTEVIYTVTSPCDESFSFFTSLQEM